MLKRTRFVIGVVVVAGIVLAAVGASAVFAQGRSGTPLFGGGFGCGGYGYGGGLSGYGSMMSLTLVPDVAEAIGISSDMLIAELQNGKTLADIITAHGKTVVEVTSLVLNARKAALDQAVKAGQITQAQADATLAQLESQITYWLQNSGAGGVGGYGGCGGYGVNGGYIGCPYATSLNGGQGQLSGSTSYGRGMMGGGFGRTLAGATRSY